MSWRFRVQTLSGQSGSQGANAPLICNFWTSSTLVLLKTKTCPMGFNPAAWTARDQLAIGVRGPGRRLVNISWRAFATSAYCRSLSPLNIPGWYKGGGPQSFVTACEQYVSFASLQAYSCIYSLSSIEDMCGCTACWPTGAPGRARARCVGMS